MVLNNTAGMILSKLVMLHPKIRKKKKKKIDII